MVKTFDCGAGGQDFFLAEMWKTPSVHLAESGYRIYFRAPGVGRLAGPRFPYAVTTETVTL